MLIKTNMMKMLEKMHNKSIEQILGEMYVERNMRLVDIAEELGISFDTTRRWIFDLNLQRNRPLIPINITKKQRKELLKVRETLENDNTICQYCFHYDVEKEICNVGMTDTSNVSDCVHFSTMLDIENVIEYPEDW